MDPLRLLSIEQRPKSARAQQEVHLDDSLCWAYL
jgi:hypothetical protein